MGKFAILLNGDLTVTERLKSQLDGAVFVGADSGMRHAQTLDVKPQCWIGDFDSSSMRLMERWPDVPRQSHPRDKDITDGALAIEYAIKNGAREIILVGAMGGRSDQVLSHWTQLVKLRKSGVSCFATTGDEEVWPVTGGEMMLDLPLKTQISLIGFSTLDGVDLDGVKWPLSGAKIGFGDTIGVSNVTTGKVRINIDSGCGVAIINRLL